MSLKTCVLVGNGKFEKSYASLIDSYNHVYRFNRFTTKDNFAKLVGVKCTHWIINNALATDAKDLFRKNIESYKTKYPNLENVLVLTNKSNNIDKLQEIKNQYKIFDFYISDFKFTNQKSSTGVLAVNYLLDKYDEIHLIGFDFGKSNHYWVSKNPSASDVPGRHNWSAEKEYIMNLVELGRVKII